MPDVSASAGKGRPAGPCDHEFQFDAELEDWVCQKCGKALALVSQDERHECGPDCDRHGDVAAIG